MVAPNTLKCLWPCLPTYLKSRFAIDFSSEAKVDENWEHLSAPYSADRYTKILRLAPAYVTAPQEPSHLSASKFLSWRQVGARHAIP